MQLSEALGRGVDDTEDFGGSVLSDKRRVPVGRALR